MRLGRIGVCERERAMDGKMVLVETGLSDEVEYRGASYTRHARTRFVDKPEPVRPRAPRLGDPWCPLTVRARLHRMAEVFRLVPHDPDTRPTKERSCMPTPKREIFKDQPGEPMRIPVARSDLAAAKQVLDSMITLNRAKRIITWSIANRISDRRLGRYIRKDHKTAARLKQIVLAELANDWNARAWSLELLDVRGARDMIHRIID